MESKYKIGQKVRVKSLDWYNNNKEDGLGGVRIGDKKPKFTYAMSKYCGQVLTVDDLSEYEGEYYMIEDDGIHVWADEMFEGVVDDQLYHPDMSGRYHSDSKLDIVDDYIHRLKGNECQIALPEGYQFVDRQGNIIDTPLIMVKKKGVEYPKTYEECCEILEDVADCSLSCFACGLLNNLQKLLLCRDAYWTIAGREMGLGKSWEPDYTKDRYIICRLKDKILRGHRISGVIEHFILEFPTEEMRDAFFNAFRDDIEKCKELL